MNNIQKEIAQAIDTEIIKMLTNMPATTLNRREVKPRYWYKGSFASMLDIEEVASRLQEIDEATFNLLVANCIDDGYDERVGYHKYYDKSTNETVYASYYCKQALITNAKWFKATKLTVEVHC